MHSGLGSLRFDRKLVERQLTARLQEWRRLLGREGRLDPPFGAPEDNFGVRAGGAAILFVRSATLDRVSEFPNWAAHVGDLARSR
jgi:hypothetical protein